MLAGKQGVELGVPKAKTVSGRQGVELGRVIPMAMTVTGKETVMACTTGPGESNREGEQQERGTNYYCNWHVHVHSPALSPLIAAALGLRVGD